MTNRHVLLALGLGSSAALAFGWVAMGSAQLGPLDPPAGPISDTSPSLADLQDGIDTLISQQGGGSGVEGPWSSYFVAPLGGANDQRDAVEIAGGRVLLHSIVVHNAAAVAFDSDQGVINSDGIPNSSQSSSTPVARASMRAIEGAGRTQWTSVGHEFDVVLDDGLYIAYEAFGNQATVQVLYRTLDP